MSVGDFLARAATAATELRGAPFVVNLCETRLGFLCGYVAALGVGATTLMPSSRAPEVVAAVVDACPGCRVYTEESPEPATDPPATWPDVAGMLGTTRPAMIGYTSGSTGTPTAHQKFWASVCVSTELNARALRAAIAPGRADARPWIVGTVPSQHMYGMELTVLLPLLQGFGIHAGRPLLPAEVAAALAEVPAPRVLVSTPAHLRALLASRIALPPTDVVASATAPLDADTARAIEDATGGEVVEMFGATETCIIATRRTSRGARWSAYPGARFFPGKGGTRVEAPWFRSPQHLLDVIDSDEHGTFELIGRSADLIDVAGKRASLADVTQKLLAVPGVIDAVVFQPEEARGLVQRLAAFVVAPSRTVREIRGALESALDPAFLPRPLVLVERLPRAPSGKLPREALRALWSEHLGRSSE